MPNTPEQHKIIAEVEIGCALNRMSISQGYEIYNEHGLKNAAKDLEKYVKGTRERLLNVEPAHMKAAGTNAKAMLKVLFKLGNEQHILNFISALEAEQGLRDKPNGKVTEAIENTNQILEKR